MTSEKDTELKLPKLNIDLDYAQIEGARGELYCLTSKGIKYYRTKKNLDENSCICIAKFQYFEIKTIFKKHNKNNDQFFEVELNDEHFDAIDLDDLAKRLSRYLTHKNMVNMAALLLQYLYNFNEQIPTKIYVSEMGINRNFEWILPDNYAIECDSDIQHNIKKSIVKMLHTTPINPIEKITTVYNAITLSNKNIIFASLIAAPFANALKQQFHMIPLVVILGKVGIGKSKLLEFYLKTFWGIKDNFIDVSKLKSSSQLGDYLSSSYFPVVIDDIKATTNPEKLDWINSTITNDVNYTKKNVDQTLKIDRLIGAPIFLTLNQIPKVFSTDLSKISRIFVIETETTATKQSKNQWNDAIVHVLEGELGKFYYETVKNKKPEIETILDQIKTPESILTARMDSIYKYITFGAEITKLVFGLELDLSNLETMILDTQKYIDRMYNDLITVQIQKNRHGWPHKKIPVQNKPTEHFIYRREKLLELNKEYNLRSNIDNLIELMQIISVFWPNVIYREQCKLQDKHSAGILIPTEYIPLEVDINSEKVEIPDDRQ